MSVLEQEQNRGNGGAAEAELPKQSNILTELFSAFMTGVSGRGAATGPRTPMHKGQEPRQPLINHGGGGGFTAVVGMVAGAFFREALTYAATAGGEQLSQRLDYQMNGSPYSQWKRELRNKHKKDLLRKRYALYRRHTNRMDRLRYRGLYEDALAKAKAAKA